PLVVSSSYLQAFCDHIAIQTDRNAINVRGEKVQYRRYPGDGGLQIQTLHERPTTTEANRRENKRRDRRRCRMWVGRRLSHVRDRRFELPDSLALGIEIGGQIARRFLLVLDLRG